MKTYLILLSLMTSSLFAETLSKSTKDLLIARRDQVKTWATLCKPGQNIELPHPYHSQPNNAFNGQFSASSQGCGQGDLMIFGGLSSIGAWFAGDTEWALARHKEQHLSQESSGRWVRGPSWVGLTEAKDAFSRDQGSGMRLYFIVGLDRIAQAKNPEIKKALEIQYQEEFYRWLSWIEFKGNGRMCVGDQRCQINGFFGSSLYRIGKRLGAINSENKKWKVVKNLKIMNDIFRGLEWSAETAFTPIDYQMLLKMIDYIVESYLGEIDQKWLKTAAKTIHQKDPTHLMYKFLAGGVTQRLINDVLVACPAISPTGHRFVNQWMQRSINQTFNSSSGHDCLLLLNLMIADLDGKIPWMPNTLSNTSPSTRTSCPYGSTQKGTHPFYSVQWPKCFNKSDPEISLVNCYKIDVDWAGKATITETIDGQQMCGIPKDEYYKLRPITRVCPWPQEHVGMYWETWPVCKKLVQTSVSQCKLDAVTYSFHSQVTGKDYCIKQDEFFFTAREIK